MTLAADEADTAPETSLTCDGYSNGNLIKMSEVQSNPLNCRRRVEELSEPDYACEDLKIGKLVTWTATLEPVKELANDFWYQKPF